MVDWEFIMHHHSATKDGATFSARAIRNYHVNTLGWQDVGYQYLIELVDDEYEVIVGRPLHHAGAHCKEHGMNKRAIGVCWVGNYDLLEVPEEMITVACRRLLKPLMAVFPQITLKHHLLHRSFARYKSCPGSMFPMLDVLRCLADMEV